MPSKSKNKGNNFEREIAKYFSKLYNKPFLRTPTSGAMTGGSNAVRKVKMDDGQIKTFRGDIIPPDDFEICIECKNYKNFPFHLFLHNKKIPLLERWINEVEYDAKDMLWLLFFKISNKGIYVCGDCRGSELVKDLLNIYKYQNRYFVMEISDFFIKNKKELLYLMEK